MRTLNTFLRCTAALSVLIFSEDAAALAASPAGKIMELKYFNIRGVAEQNRILFAIGKEKYKDTRYDFDMKTFKAPEFEAGKEAGEFKANLDRLPVLVTEEGVTIGQSKAIGRFLARRFGMMGDTESQAAIVDSIVEHCRDINDACGKKGFSAFAKSKTDEEKAELRKEWFETDMPSFLGKLDEAVKQHCSEMGCAVGSKISLADVLIWMLLRDCVPGDLDDTTKAAKGCDVLNGIADKVGAHESIVSWLQKRPDTMF